MFEKIIIFFLIICNGNCDTNFKNVNDNGQINDLLDVPNLGKLQGGRGKTAWTKQNYVEFLGIPFAKPPIGSLRFKKPEPHPGWKDTLNATVFGRGCPVSNLVVNLPKSQQKDDILEDCLFLNVFTKSTNAKRCVMVYIHGGALINGTAADYSPDFLLEKDIVLVTIQYRLSALGFLSTRTEDIPGNAGLMDVVLALNWIQQNIKSFGGDPNCVTVFGQSAGACITGLLLISPYVRCDLFQRAIMQSGNSLVDAINQLNPLERAQLTCQAVNCTKCDDIDDVNQCLKSASAVDLLVAGESLGGLVPFGFSPDDFYGIYPNSPTDAISQRSNCFQYMAGTVKHEGGFLTAAGGSSTIPKVFSQTLISNFGEFDPYGTIELLTERLYFDDGKLLDKEPLVNLAPQMVDMAGDYVFKQPFIIYNALYNCSENKSCSKKNGGNNYLYSFEYAGEYYWKPYMEQFIPPMEDKFEHKYPFNKCHVYHADDLLYLFPAQPLNQNDLKQAKMMVDLWTSFAIKGKPETAYSQTDIQAAISSRGPYFQITDKITIKKDTIDILKAATKSYKEMNCDGINPDKCCRSS